MKWLVDDDFLVFLLILCIYCCLGSDLDGDEYCVIFDHECFFNHNEKAMAFTKTKTDDIEEIPTVESFFYYGFSC